MPNLPNRKPNRLEFYDYTEAGGHFITICTAQKRKILSDIDQNVVVGAPIGRPPEPQLTPIGEIAKEAILNIPHIYPMVEIEDYVIMPNHIHLLLWILEDENGRPMGAPTVGNIINQFKGYVSKCVGRPIWQKLFYDHVIRNKKDHEAISKYIENNPATWLEDELYEKEVTAR